MPLAAPPLQPNTTSVCFQPSFLWVYLPFEFFIAPPAVVLQDIWHALMRPAKHLRQKHPLYGTARHRLSEIFKGCKESCPRKSFNCLEAADIFISLHRAAVLVAEKRHTNQSFTTAMNQWLEFCLKNDETVFMTDAERLDTACERIRSNASVNQYLAQMDEEVVCCFLVGILYVQDPRLVICL